MKQIKRFIPYKREIKKTVFGMVNNFGYLVSSNSLHSNRLASVSRVHFICKGNICRSVFAEKLAAEKFYEKNIPLQVISSGIDADQGNTSPNEAIKEAKNWNIDLSSHKPKRISSNMVDTHTLLIGMHFIHFKQLNKLYPEFKDMIYLFKHFARMKFLFIDLSDPYNPGQEVFHQCFSEINICIDGLIAELKQYY